MKDTINMTRFSAVEIDFIADDPGPSLLHCHHQDHQDEGFIGLFNRRIRERWIKVLRLMGQTKSDDLGLP